MLFQGYRFWALPLILVNLLCVSLLSASVVSAASQKGQLNEQNLIQSTTVVLSTVSEHTAEPQRHELEFRQPAEQPTLCGKVVGLTLVSGLTGSLRDGFLPCGEDTPYLLDGSAAQPLPSSAEGFYRLYDPVLADIKLVAIGYPSPVTKRLVSWSRAETITSCAVCSAPPPVNISGCAPSSCAPTNVFFSAGLQHEANTPVSGCIVHVDALEDHLLGDTVVAVSILEPFREVPLIGPFVDAIPLSMAEKWAAEVVKAVDGEQTYTHVAWRILVDVGLKYLGGKLIQGTLELENVTVREADALNDLVVGPMLSKIEQTLEQHADEWVRWYQASHPWAFTSLEHCIDTGSLEEGNRVSCYSNYRAFRRQYPRTNQFLHTAQVLFCNPAKSSVDTETGSIAYVDAATGDIWIANTYGTGKRRLTSSGNNRHPVWSPDGKYLIYENHSESFPDLYLLDLATGNRSLWASDACCAAWSPRSPWIVYISYADRSLVAQSVEDSTTEVLVLGILDIGLGANPTGNILYEAEGESMFVPLQVLVRGDPPWPTTEIWTVKARTLETDIFQSPVVDSAEVQEGGACLHGPVISPSGQYQAFTADTLTCGVFAPGGITLFLQDAYGHIQEYFGLAHPSWSPDSTQLAVETYRTHPRVPGLTLSGVAILDVASGVVGPVITSNALQPAWRPVPAKADTSSSLDESDTFSAQEPRDITAAAQVSASSTLPNDRWGNYMASQAVDGNPATAWVEGQRGPGLGEWLEFTFASPVSVAKIELNIGYDSDEEVFFANNRVRRATFVLDGGVLDVLLEDRRGLQTIGIAEQFFGRPEETSKIQIFIEEVYPGARYDDTAISEVKIWGTTTERKR